MRKLRVELANTFEKREKGLMHRKHLDSDEGMLFKFPYSANLSFWMKNTYLPSQIAFINDHGKIFQIERMSPLCTKAISARQPCRYALEVNDGWFAKNNVKEGDLVKGYGISNLNRKAQIINEQIMRDMQQNQPAEEEQIEQHVQLNMSYRDKIRYAEQKSLPMEIVYISLSGKNLPPRKLIPIEGEGYPIKSGPNGDYFCGFDTSPNIPSLFIEGSTPKNFLFSNIVSLEVIEESLPLNKTAPEIQEPKGTEQVEETEEGGFLKNLKDIFKGNWNKK